MKKLLAGLLLLSICVARAQNPPFTLDTSVPHLADDGSTYYGDDLPTAAGKLNSNVVYFAAITVNSSNQIAVNLNSLIVVSNWAAATLVTNTWLSLRTGTNEAALSLQQTEIATLANNQTNINVVFLRTNGLGGTLTAGMVVTLKSDGTFTVSNAPGGALAPPVTIDAANAYTNTYGGARGTLPVNIQGGLASAPGVSGATAFGNGALASSDDAFASGYATTASAPDSFAANTSTIADGYSATAFGNSSHADGTASFAAGFLNIASGATAFALGQRAYATNDNSFVWSDDTDFSSRTNNEFAVHANNGVRIVTGGAGLTVDGNLVGVATVGSLYSFIDVSGAISNAVNFNGHYLPNGQGYYTNTVSGWYVVPAGKIRGISTNGSIFSVHSSSLCELATNIYTGTDPSVNGTFPGYYSATLLGNYIALNSSPTNSPTVTGDGIFGITTNITLLGGATLHITNGIIKAYN